MSYERQNFTRGQTLTAAHLNHMEAGIVEAEKTGGTASLSIGNVTSGSTASASITDGKLNLVLPKGDKGASGVYIGAESSAGSDVQLLIDPNSEGTDWNLPYSEGYQYFQVAVNTSSLPSGADNKVLDSNTTGAVWCALKLPASYEQYGVKTKLAVCMHGAGGLLYNGHPGELADFENLVSAGYAIMDCAGVTGDATAANSAEHMGGPVAIQAYQKAVDYVTNHYNVEDSIFLHGHSMGGLAALNYASLFGNRVRAIGLYHPVTDLYNQAWLHPWATRIKAKIAKVYNFSDQTGVTWESDKATGYNPIENHSVVIDSTRYIDLQMPIRVWHGSADTVVSLEGSQAYITALRNAGVAASLRTVTGVGHEYNDAMKTELQRWFDRF